LFATGINAKFSYSSIVVCSGGFKGGGGGRPVLPQNMGGTRICELGAARGQDRGHR